MNQALFKFYFKTALFLSITVLLAPFYVLILVVFFRWRRYIGPKLVQFYSRICLSIFRVKIERGPNSQIVEKSKGILIISNHVSFLDIFVLSALFGSLFVSKAEVKYYPIIGQVASLAGVIFFDRSSSRERLRVLNSIVNGCSSRIFTIFPQGTTCGIQQQLSFNRGIFKAVELNPDISLLPLTLHYKEDREIAWNKPQSLKENAVRVCSQRRIHVRVTLHDPVTINDYRGKATSQICKTVEQTVLGSLQNDYP